jgi:hypothetical protein
MGESTSIEGSATTDAIALSNRDPPDVTVSRRRLRSGCRRTARGLAWGSNPDKAALRG